MIIIMVPANVIQPTQPLGSLADLDPLADLADCLGTLVSVMRAPSSSGSTPPASARVDLCTSSQAGEPPCGCVS
jgi:hypothetical protein